MLARRRKIRLGTGMAYSVAVSLELARSWSAASQSFVFELLDVHSIVLVVRPAVAAALDGFLRDT